MKKRAEKTEPELIKVEVIPLESLIYTGDLSPFVLLKKLTNHYPKTKKNS